MIPERTFAVVVGIESYAAGSDWNLNGPAADAMLFVEWLRDRDVPAANILLFLSPLAKNKNEIEQRRATTGVLAQDARLTPIHDTLALTLPALEGDLLFLFWGGHGVVTRGEDRRLFYADATTGDKKNLDFQSLLEMLRSASMSKLTRQIAYVDSCANFFSEMRSVVDLKGDQIPTGPEAMGFEQEILFAAASGEVAVNEGGRGLFSAFLLDWLKKDKSGAWPPNQADLRNAVRQHFAELHAKGESAQSPMYFIWIDPAGVWREGPIPPPREVLVAARASGLAAEQLRGVAAVLLDCPTMLERHNRDTLYGQFPTAMQHRVVRAPQDWEFGGDYEAALAVGLTRPVVLRWRERIRDAANAKQGFWISRAGKIRQRLRTAAAAPTLLWVAPDKYDVASLRKRLAREDAEDFVVLLFLPPEIPPDVKQDLLIAALVSGAPYALWLDADPKQLGDLEKEIKNLTQAGELDLLPWRVRQLRQAAQGDPKHFASSLNVVWDVPEHTPPDWRIAAPEYKENP